MQINPSVILLPFRCYVAEDMSSGQLIGYILFFNTLDERSIDDPVAVVEDLFVKPEFRGRGIATQLWKKALKVSILFETLRSLAIS